MARLTHREIVSRFRTILEADGVRGALGFLNQQGAHRFTGLFRFDGGTLRNLHLIDRDDPTVERCPDQPVLDSYCVYVRQTGQTFVTADTRDDPRVEGHPKQHSVQSYCGVLLLEENGELFGTICHFDFDPVPFSSEEVFLLEDVASTLMQAIRATESHPEQRSA